MSRGTIENSRLAERVRSMMAEMAERDRKFKPETARNMGERLVNNRSEIARDVGGIVLRPDFEIEQVPTDEYDTEAVQATPQAA